MYGIMRLCLKMMYTKSSSQLSWEMRIVNQNYGIAWDTLQANSYVSWSKDWIYYNILYGYNHILQYILVVYGYDIYEFHYNIMVCSAEGLSLLSRQWVVNCQHS